MSKERGVRGGRERKRREREGRERGKGGEERAEGRKGEERKKEGEREGEEEREGRERIRGEGGCITMECRKPRRLIHALCEVIGVTSLPHHSVLLNAPYLPLWM